MPHLPIIRILKEAYWQMWEHWVAMVRTLLIPATLITFVEAMDKRHVEHWSLADGALSLVSVGFYTIFAVTCHRIILLGDGSVPKYGLWRWRWREMRFCLWSFGVLILALIAAFPGRLVLGYMYEDVGVYDDRTYWLKAFVLMLPAMYVFARLSLLLPAIATDREITLGNAWRLSRENGWRLTVLIVLLPIILGFIKTKLSPWDPRAAIHTIASLAGSVLFAFEVVVLSLSYKYFTTTGADGAAGGANLDIRQSETGSACER